MLEGDEFYVGRPIIVTRNDRQTGLSNGDTGVVVGVADGRRQVWFPDLAGGGERFLLAPSRLPEHESFFALTVHRAQGSEYDEVVFIPGDPESRVSTRELFYTAVTRARRKVTVLADAGCRAHRGAAHNIPRHRAVGPACGRCLRWSDTFHGDARRAVLMPFGCTGHGKLSPQRLGEDYRYQAACMRYSSA